MSNKLIVFVHGSDKKQALTPWMFYHLHPSKYGSTPQLSDGAFFDLIYFDYETGVRKEWKNWSAVRSRTPPAGVPAESQLLPAPEIRDDQGALYSPTRKRPSADAFYRWVKIQKAGSIASIQIFSHATILQPILFPDSYEWGGNDEGDKQGEVTADRDPHDCEFRLRDFEGNNPLAPGKTGELQKFKAALAPDCFIKVWGCGEQSLTHNDGAYVRKFLTEYLAVKPGKAGDVRRAGLIVSYLWVIKDFWPYKLAAALNMPVWGGPVGWGTDPFDVDGVYKPSTYARDKWTWKGTFPPNLKQKEWWWRVSAGFRSNPKLAEIFTRDLKAKMDATGYVEYQKSWYDAADRAAQAIVTPKSSPASGVLTPQNLMDGLNEQMRLFATGRSTTEE